MAADCISFDFTQLSILFYIIFIIKKNIKNIIQISYILLIKGRPKDPQDHGLP